MPVTTTVYKTISQLPQCTPSIKSTVAKIPEPLYSGPFNRNEMVPVTSPQVVIKTIVSTSTAPYFCTVPSEDMQQIENQYKGNQHQLSRALGALLGLVVVVLAVVITGWVWTCWIVKKQGGMKITSNKQER